MDLTMDKFISLCILLGCDYCPRITGIGPVTALKHIKSGMDPLHLSPDGNYKSRYDVAWRMFTDHNVSLVSEAGKEVDRDDFKGWVLSSTNYTEQTLTSKLTSYWEIGTPASHASAPKKPLKVTVKTKPKIATV
jgi:5'-3' exonuclease